MMCFMMLSTSLISSRYDLETSSKNSVISLCFLKQLLISVL